MMIPKFLAAALSPHRGSILPEWGSGFVAVMALLLIFSEPFRAMTSESTLVPGSIEQEQHRLQRFIDVLHSEGAVHAIAPCLDFDICVRVTDLFRELDRGDKRGIGRLIRDYFFTHPEGTRFVSRVRFIDAETGIELGSYAEGRLDWKEIL